MIVRRIGSSSIANTSTSSGNAQKQLTGTKTGLYYAPQSRSHEQCAPLPCHCNPSSTTLALGTLGLLSPSPVYSKKAKGSPGAESEHLLFLHLPTVPGVTAKHPQAEGVSWLGAAVTFLIMARRFLPLEKTGERRLSEGWPREDPNQI